MALARSRYSSESGFSLVEVLVATGILMVGVVALGQMFYMSTTANRVARVSTMATMLAEQKMEQLRSLTWGFDTLGLPLSDTSTDISKSPVTAGGTGLSPSPPGTLTKNTTGYVDYCDQYGNWVGSGDTPTAGTVYIRRWSIEPLPTNPNNTLILQVLVTRRDDRTLDTTTSTLRQPEEARLVSVKTRKTI